MWARFPNAITFLITRFLNCLLIAVHDHYIESGFQIHYVIGTGGMVQVILIRDFANGVARMVSLPLFPFSCLNFRFLPLFPFFFRCLPFSSRFLPRFLPFSSIFPFFLFLSRFILRKKRVRHRSRDPFCETPTHAAIQVTKGTMALEWGCGVLVLRRRQCSASFPRQSKTWKLQMHSRVLGRSANAECSHQRLVVEMS